MACTADKAPPTRPDARYKPVSPSSAGGNSFGNFLWVVDTETGSVSAYRIARMVSENKNEPGQWVTEKLPSDKASVGFVPLDKE